MSRRDGEIPNVHDQAAAYTDGRVNDKLAQHFALADSGSDEPSEWREITAADVVEGELWDDPNVPNRMRLVRIDPERGPVFDVEIHAHGDRVRVRLPFRLSQLPETITEPNDWHHELTGEHGAHGQQLDEVVIDSIRRRWFEQIEDETHMVIEVVA